MVGDKGRVGKNMAAAIAFATSLMLMPMKQGCSFSPSSLARRSSCQTCSLTSLCAIQQQNYFLLKSEPDEFSIHDLQKCQEDEWDGVRNFQARNKMRLMKPGDLAFFYHSSCKVPAIVGIMRVIREAAPDITALDPNHKGYDAKSITDDCRWDAVRVGFESILENPVTLKHLKAVAQNDDEIADMTLLRQSRLSVHEVTPEQWDRIMELSHQSEDGGEEKPYKQSKSRKRKDVS